MPELTLRDGMVIVGSLLILAVAIDAWRRMRQQQRSRVRVRLATEVPADGPVDDINQFRELPNGGARVVRREESTEKSLESLGLRAGGAGSPAKEERDSKAAENAAEADGKGFRKVARAGSRTEDTAGIADSDADAAGATAGGRSNVAAKEVGKDTAKDSARATARAAAMELAGVERVPAKAPSGDLSAIERAAADAGVATAADHGADDVDDFDDEAGPLAGVSARDDEPANLDWLVDLPATEPVAEAEAGELPRQSDAEVIVLHVTARDESGFGGHEILEILLACDLRFGDMDFFHRHEQQAGRGPIQFSVANMLQPGVFDIDRMDEMRTRGLVFFLTLPGPEDMLLAFDCMLETARAVARNLKGELLDESRSVLTQQAVEHYRQQIRELDRRLRAREA